MISPKPATVLIALIGFALVAAVQARIKGIRLGTPTPAQSLPESYMWISTNGSAGNIGSLSSPRTEADALAADGSVINYDRASRPGAT